MTGYKEDSDRWDIVMDLDGSLKSLKPEVLTVMEPTVYDDETPLEIAAGSKVKVFGLESEAAQKYNDTEGVVIQLKEDTLRWDVVMDLDGSLKSLTEENLEVLHQEFQQQGAEINFQALAEAMGLKAG